MGERVEFRKPRALDPEATLWKEWKLPGPRPQAYVVWVDPEDAVWVSEWSANAVLRFNLPSEMFLTVPSDQLNADVRQILGAKARFTLAGGPPRVSRGDLLVLGSVLALLRGWRGWELALKLAYEFALRLDEPYRVFISHVVKVAGLVDFFFSVNRFNSRPSSSGARLAALAFGKCVSSSVTSVECALCRPAVPHQPVQDPCA
jgi:hypothetical protein